MHCLQDKAPLNFQMNLNFRFYLFLYNVDKELNLKRELCNNVWSLILAIY
jgi:hypothetical protein